MARVGMAPTALVNGRVLLDDGFASGKTVLLDAGRIAAIVADGDARCAGAERIDLQGARLMPGFVDIQVNGGGGGLFNTKRDVETLRIIAAAHRKFGTTSLLPTLISDDLPIVAEAIRAVRDAIAAGVPGIAGIHIEGPFLNEVRKGAHDAGKFRTLDAAAVELLASLQTGRTLVTLAPEMNGMEEIAALAARGVIISAGHTNASHAVIEEALRHGVTGFTHLFNAMSPLTTREPGVVGAALHDQASWCGIIVDGHHVSPVTLQLALRCKPHNRFMLVTDAMPGVGTDATSFDLQGREIFVRDGKCIDEQGTLSGSALDMASAVRNAVNLLGLDLAEAARMASTYPATFLRVDGEIGRIAVGLRANLVATDESVNVLDTWIDGQRPGNATDVAHGSEREAA
ncbi:MAG: N-acetylglucosamine-6-phosphate deacetylase [Betaproteobacteria bacterium]